MRKMKYFVSRGNSIGFYSDYIPANQHQTVKSAYEWGMDQYHGDFTVWMVDPETNEPIEVE